MWNSNHMNISSQSLKLVRFAAKSGTPEPETLHIYHKSQIVYDLITGWVFQIQISKSPTEENCFQNSADFPLLLHRKNSHNKDACM